MNFVKMLCQSATNCLQNCRYGVSQEVRNRAYASAASESQGISFVFNRTAFIRKLKISEIKQYKGKFDYAIEPGLGFCDSNYFDINMFL